MLSPKKSKAEETVLSSVGHYVNVQMLRSLKNWSADVKHEASIYCAYLDSIRNAKYFIYIENQFFISLQSYVLGKDQNKIQSALVEIIVPAHNAN